MAENEVAVLVVSESTLLREGIGALLRSCPKVRIVGMIEAGERVVEKARQLQPQVLVLNVPGTSSAPIGLLGQLKTELPELGILAVNHHQDVPDEPSLLMLLQRGIRGYVCGRHGAAELAAAVQAVAGGDCYLCPAASHVLVKECRQKLRRDQLSSEVL